LHHVHAVAEIDVGVWISDVPRCTPGTWVGSRTAGRHCFGVRATTWL
jgi:hypothetical protein